jgi:hypothetical protein
VTPTTVTATATVAANLRGEGFIQVSSGVRNRGDVASLKYGFQNPIALVELHHRSVQSVYVVTQ